LPACFKDARGVDGRVRQVQVRRIRDRRTGTFFAVVLKGSEMPLTVLAASQVSWRRLPPSATSVGDNRGLGIVGGELQKVRSHARRTVGP